VKVFTTGVVTHHISTLKIRVYPFTTWLIGAAAYRTPPGKDAGGTEINPSPFKITVSAVDITFFIY